MYKKEYYYYDGVWNVWNVFSWLSVGFIFSFTDGHHGENFDLRC